ncbi:zinc-dependent metalloprotease family protein [uncultured Alistipes sp.]|uniref:zinc-dependent metalloprotease family protein n=1 Tax=uncultured Alistipes sp. TaxID=538949 RepID=UPI00259B37CC|nr:zinc-dependent metalloprotease family protein [uncultured Alistipes sp.]
MKRLLFFAGLLSILASCSKEPQEGPQQPETKALEVALNSFTYESLMTDLSERTSLDKVVLSDGELTRSVSLTASDNLDPDQADALVFNSADADSVDLTVAPGYVAIRMTVDGQQKAWIAYGDPETQEAVEQRYASLGAATKSGSAVMTRSAVAGGALCLDLTAMAESMGSDYVLSDVEDVQDAVATKGLFSNLFKKVVGVFKPAPKPAPKTPTIDIYLCKERGANPLTHEMNWQVNDAISSLKDVQSNVKFNVHIVSCDFKGSNDAAKDAANFRNWVQKGSFRNTDGIFVLCRWGGWGISTLGYAYIGDYDVNNDRQSYAITCTNAWYKYCMAHEIGHNFGAEHVEMHWYDYLWNTDLMTPGDAGPFKTCKHKNAKNREEIKRRLTLR